jgi:hypothetical protein
MFLGSHGTVSTALPYGNPKAETQQIRRANSTSKTTSRRALSIKGSDVLGLTRLVMFKCPQERGEGKGSAEYASQMDFLRDLNYSGCLSFAIPRCSSMALPSRG